jgi:hypothetical protein
MRIIFYGPFLGDIDTEFWLAPLLTVMIFVICWLIMRPPKYSWGDIIAYLAVVLAILAVVVNGQFNLTFGAYYFGYLDLALAAVFFSYSSLKHLRQVKQLRMPTLKTLEKIRRPMILFIILACLISYLYFNNVIWNWAARKAKSASKPSNEHSAVNPPTASCTKWSTVGLQERRLRIRISPAHSCITVWLGGFRFLRFPTNLTSLT